MCNTQLELYIDGAYGNSPSAWRALLKFKDQRKKLFACEPDSIKLQGEKKAHHDVNWV